MFTITAFLIVLSSILTIVFWKCSTYNPPPIFQVYRRPKGNYYLKVAFMWTILTLRKLKSKKPQDILSLETAKELSIHPKAIDAVYLNGANSQGDHLVVGTARRKNGLIDGFLYLKLKNTPFGVLETIRLPNTSLYQKEGDKDYEAEGIKLSLVEPMKQWTLSFESLLKENGCKDKVYSAKIQATWTSNLPVFNFDCDMSSKATAKAMALETFNRNYFKLLEKHHQTHYEQFGVLQGSVEINGQKFKLELDTLRDHSFGEFRDWSNFRRYALHFFSASNGDRFNVGVICAPLTFSRLLIGYVYSAEDKQCYALEECDLELFEFGESGQGPQDYSFRFKTKRKSYEVQVKVVDSPHFYISKNWEAKVVEKLCKFKINGLDGWGAAEWEFRNVEGQNVEDFDENLFK